MTMRISIKRHQVLLASQRRMLFLIRESLILLATTLPTTIKGSELAKNLTSARIAMGLPVFNVGHLK
jgi:hypothetical protein